MEQTCSGFDKKKLECFKCHNTGHFARECTSKGTNDGKKRDSFSQDQGARKKEQNQNCLLTMDDGVVNWGEHTVEEEETNHALMAINTNNEVSLCSKTCIDSYYKLKTLCDEQTNQLGEQEAKILAYDQVRLLDKPFYSRFSKTDNFKGVPHPLTGDYTPQPQQEIDDSLYVYGKKGPQKPETSVSDDKFSENSVTSNEEVVSAPKPKEAEPSCVTHVKTPKQPMKNQGTPKVNGKNWNEMMERELGEGYSFIKKKCFVCGSLSHLIRDCDFYEKKMAREAELKKQRVFNTGNGVAKPVWNNANKVNHANHFVPRPVQLIAVRQNVNSVRPNVNTGRANVNSVRQNVNSVRSNVNTGSFNINTVKAKQPINTSNSNSFSPVKLQIITSRNMDDKSVYLIVQRLLKGIGRIRVEKLNVKGVGYRWMFDIDYLTDSMNYIHVSLENQTNPHAGTLEVTNSAGTLQTPNANASEEEDEAEELIVVPTAVRHTASKVRPRKSSTNSKQRCFRQSFQNLKTQRGGYSTGIQKDTPEISSFRRELDELAPKHLREVPKNKATSTTSVNSGSGPVNTQHADQDDSDMPELTIFNKPQKGIFDEASYDDEGMVHDFNNLPTEVAVSPIPTLRIHNIHP
ncbi:ribonuclease H-like domain-containing protein [Tanacetum coccineum]